MLAEGIGGSPPGPPPGKLTPEGAPQSPAAWNCGFCGVVAGGLAIFGGGVVGIVFVQSKGGVGALPLVGLAVQGPL